MRLPLLPAALLLIAAAPPPMAITLPADAPIAASINGQPVSLSLATGAVDRITLNLDTVARLGLKPASFKGKANVRVGRTRVLPGRTTPGKVALAGQAFNQRIFWFEGAGPIPEQGSIGPMALPQAQVTVVLNPAGGGTDWALPLVGGINSGSYGGVKGGGVPFALSADVRGRQRLPLATAALGADIAAGLGGRLVGEAWEEEIFLGVRRPVRRLVLDKPLELGPFRFSEIAVRVNDRRDGMAQLAPGQTAPPDAEDDPAELLVSADTGKKRRVVRVFTLSRTQLEAARCSALVVDKAARRFVLRC
ncbi:MAG: hypothetical protein KGQ52_04555 [Alphaproteobacteria bacterium]|nr:hypothetical protein [Alphaproteobacteria bacterium]